MTEQWFSDGDIGTPLYEWHTPLSSKTVDYGTYHEIQLALERRIKKNRKDDPCVESQSEVYYKVINSLCFLSYFNVVN